MEKMLPAEVLGATAAGVLSAAAAEDPAKSDKKESSSIGKRETRKSTEKTAPVDKSKTAKEEARELLLKEEASVREKVGHVQKNLALMLNALGELAIANPTFTHGQLPHLVNYIEPLLSSPIVSDAAFCAMLRLARCTAPPLCNWATDIAAAIRVISVEDFELVLDLMPVIIEDSKKRPSPGLFEQIVTGLTTACKAGPLPADSFTFIFPIMETILLSSKKTCLHDDVLQIVSLHLDPILPLLRPRMLSVLYHVLSMVPAYEPSVGPMLKKLCLSLNGNDLAKALVGVYAEEVHVRFACLTAIKWVPSQPAQGDSQVSAMLQIAARDKNQEVAALAVKLRRRFGYDDFTDYSGLFDALSHRNYNVRDAAAEALADALNMNPEKMEVTLSSLVELYIRHLSPCVKSGDTNWLGRQGIALALEYVAFADALGSKQLVFVIKFLISHALADPNLDVRDRMISAGTLIIDNHGKRNASSLFTIFKSYLEQRDSEDLVRVGIIKLTDTLAKYLSKDDSTRYVVDKLTFVPAEVVHTSEDRIMNINFVYEPVPDHLKSVATKLFDVCKLDSSLGEGLAQKYLVSMGGAGSNFYDMLFCLVERPHSRGYCLSRFTHKQIRDVGLVLSLLRYNPVKAQRGDHDILEFDVTKGVHPPYLATLLTKVKNIASATGGLSAGLNAEWRSSFSSDLAGKTFTGRIAVMVGIDLHLDCLQKKEQDYMKDIVGDVAVNWEKEALTVPSLQRTIEYKVWWDEEAKAWRPVEYNTLSLLSLNKCGRNHITHAKRSNISQKEAEAVFSSKFHKELSKINHRLILEYEEPKKDNQIAVKDIVKTKQ